MIYSWLLTGTTGMAVKEIGIPSGFSADIEALELANIAGVKRVEEGDRKVIIYLDEVPIYTSTHLPILAVINLSAYLTAKIELSSPRVRCVVDFSSQGSIGYQTT